MQIVLILLMALMLILLLFFDLLEVEATHLDPEIVLPTGRIQGHRKHLADADDHVRVYYAFEGIPYARAPVGKLRFQDPKPMKPWIGTWQTKTLSTCLQYYHYTEPGEDYVRGDEDCLHVNVYTKDLAPDADELQDVIVYIHGGAFMFNSGGTYGEKYLMQQAVADHDVVYVSFNYRLGPLGFLSMESRLLPGNMGLKDQRLALRWIKENIQSFGGNPDNIMLTGMSAGASSVHVHTLLSSNANLFHKALAMSGSALSPWALMEAGRDKTRRLARLLGCPLSATDATEMMNCLKYRPARQIVAAVKHFQPWLYNPFSPFGMVVDKWSDEPILPNHPYQLLQSKQVLNVPIVFSNVQAEGLYPGAEFAFDDKLAEIDSRFNDLLPFVLDLNHTVHPIDMTSVMHQIRTFYFGDDKITMGNFERLIEMLSDRLFLVDNERAARLHAAANARDTYFYLYSYRAANSKANARTKSKQCYGTSHGDDTIMVLSTDINVTSTSDDAQMSKLLQAMWIKFAKTCKPSVANAEWKPLSRDGRDGRDGKAAAAFNYLHIQSPFDISMESVDFMGNRKALWDQLPINENQNIKHSTYNDNNNNNEKVEL